jgi:hypothetical protein
VISNFNVAMGTFFFPVVICPGKQMLTKPIPLTQGHAILTQDMQEIRILSSNGGKNMDLTRILVKQNECLLEVLGDIVAGQVR